MKQIFLTGIAACVLASASAASTGEPFKQGDFAGYQPDIANGQVIFNAAGCAACHAVDGDDTILAGGQAITTKFGDLFAPNITADPNQGIGSWTNAQFLNALMRGLSPDGDTYFGAVFPYPSYARMKPEDALDLRGYMATLPTSDAPSREHDISYMSQTILDLWSSGRDPMTPMADAQMARGQYLVEAVGHCAECHTPRDTGYGFKYELDMSRPYEGEVGLLGEYAPDITGARLKKFGAAAFVVGAMAEAKKLNGNPMTAPSMRRIARLTASLPVDDRAAIYAYLTGEAVDASAFPQAATAPVQVAQNSAAPISGTVAADATPVTTKANLIPDLTGAKALMARVNAYCDSQEPVQAELAPAPTPVAAVAAGPDPALTKQVDQVIETYCRSCHAPGKTYATAFPTGDIADMPFDDKILRKGDPDASPLYESIASGRMPLGLKMKPEEVDALRQWIVALGASPVPAATPTPVQAATPAAPREAIDRPLFAGFTRSERMLAIVADINAVEERDRRFIRYISFANTPLAEVDCSEQGALRNPMHYLHAGFNKFINSASTGPRPVPIAPVDGTEGAIARVDLRDYGWDDDHWAAISTGVFTEHARRSGFDPEAWQDLARVYPYAVDPASDPLLRVISDATGAPVPLMRADWITHVVSEAPYYDILLGLTDQISDLEQSMGINVEREILSRRMIRSAMLPGASGVSDHNRMLERFDLPRGGYYWKSYDFAGDVGEQSLALHPDGPDGMNGTASGLPPFEHDGGEMIFSLPNGLQGYYLSTNTGDRLLVGPASIVSFRTKPIGKGVEIENARSCFDCHANGMIAKRDQMRDMLMSSQRFSRDQMDILTEFYIDNDRLSETFRNDSTAFLTALSQLNATEINAAGRMTSLNAPDSVGGGEIVTYLADMHFNALDFVTLAREFHMGIDTFKQRARTLGDPTLTVIVNDWIGRLEGGAKVHRSELELYYADILERMTDLHAYRGGATHVAGYQPEPVAPAAYEQRVDQAVHAAVAKQADPYQPAVTAPVAYAPPAPPRADRLTLSINVPRTEVYVNDLLDFTVSANQRCELQMFYVEATKNIEELPPQLLGPAFLEPGELRRIPYDGSGLQIRFDEPGKGETMLAFCRVGGLGTQRMTASGALAYAKSQFQPLTRGLSIEAAKKVAEDGGASATNHVTFNVLP